MNIATPRCRRFALVTMSVSILTLFYQPPVAGGLTSVPSPSNSTVPSCINPCPGGDGTTLEIVVRDLANVPVANSFVLLDFCECPSARLCPPHPNDNYVTDSNCRAHAITNAAGRAVFQLRMGGSCSGIVRVFADGVQLDTPVLASTDQDGDLVVTAADAALLAAKLPNDRSGDLNCDFFTDAADGAILNAHLGHTCEVPTEARGTRWGTVKIRYR